MPETPQPMEELEKRIGYEFKDKKKLEEALLAWETELLEKADS